MSDFTHRDAVETFKHPPGDVTGYIPDDSVWSDKFILQNLQEIRSAAMKDILNTGDSISEFCFQTLGCVELVEVDRNECPCAPASGCYWLKTKRSIPTPIRVVSITGVVAQGENPRFSQIEWDKFQYIPKARIESMRNGKFWAMKNTHDKEFHIYLYGDRFLEQVSITALFENPIHAAQFESCGVVDIEAKCNPMDVGYYTDAWIRDIVMRTAWQKLLPVRQAAPADQLNNDNIG